MPLGRPLLHPRMAMSLDAALFPDRANVYGEDADGNYTVLLKTDLHCRLIPLDGQLVGVNAQDRAELLALRRLEWEASYFMPEHTVQLDIGGVRWNLIAGTYATIGRGTVHVYKRADAVRVV